MQAVILSAGKGERMEALTLNIPKPLLEYKNKSLLEWKLDELPENIDNVVLIVGYLGKQIQTKIGYFYNNKKISYIWDKKIKGTGAALWQAQKILEDNFLVMMGDDLYNKEAFLNACKEPWSITVKRVSREDNASRIEFDENKKLKNFLTADKYRERYENGGYAFTGLYSLTKEIFNYSLVKMKTRDEWGLPQTFLQVVPYVDLKILETDFWKQISTPEDLNN